MFDPLESGSVPTLGRSYLSPHQVAMATAGSIAAYMPAGQFGDKTVGRGTVIPHHRPGRGGGSLGYNPHKPPHKRVIIDPHIPGQAITLDLAQVRSQDSEQAYQQGMEYADEVMTQPPEELNGIKLTTNEGPRLGVYAAVRLLAETCKASEPSQGRAMSQPIPPPPAARSVSFGDSTMGTPGPAPVQIIDGSPHSASAATTGPLARFRTGPAKSITPAPPVISSAAPQPVVTSPTPEPKLAAPSQKVIFDFGDKVGQFSTYYHEVIRVEGGLYLIWDQRWPYGEPYSPENLTQRFALEVVGFPEVYLVDPIGKIFKLEHAGYWYCPVGVVETMPAEGGIR